MLAVRFGSDQAHFGKPLKMRPLSDSCAEPFFDDAVVRDDFVNHYGVLLARGHTILRALPLPVNELRLTSERPNPERKACWDGL